MSQTRALIIGVSDYPVKKLPGVLKDAKRVREVLQSDHSVFNTEVVYLTNAKATRANIELYLKKFLLESQKDDTVLIYMAGHGEIRAKKHYFLPFSENAAPATTDLVALSPVLEMFEKCRSGRLILWLDFCHSAGILARSGADPKSFASALPRGLKVTGKGKYIYAACGALENAHEADDGSGGWFTKGLISGLTGDAATLEGEVTVFSLYECVYKYVARMAKIGGKAQLPMLHGTTGSPVVLMHSNGKKSRKNAGSGSSPAKSSARAIPKPPAARSAPTKGSSSGCLLGEHFYTSAEITRKGGEFLVLLSSASQEQSVPLHLWAKQSFHRASVPFAFGNDACLAEVKEVSETFKGGQSVWTVRLVPSSQNQILHEVRLQNYSVDDIARIRAEQILLNAAPPRDQMFDLLGFGSRGNSGLTCPFPELRKRFPANAEFLSFARLAAVYQLKSTGTVEHVLKLEIGPIRSNKLKVNFLGLRADRGSGSAQIEVNGFCEV